MAERVWDCVIIGGGPAGLSAAVYLGRFLRSTLVLDTGEGRSSGPQLNENYLGFPRGVRAARLRELGRRQAERFGVRFEQATVTHLVRTEGGFRLSNDSATWHTRTVILATGVTDIWPSFPRVQRYVGRSLFWCITCDGFRARGRRLALIGGSDEAVTTACQFLRYTDQILFIDVSLDGGPTISATKQADLDTNRIRLVRGAIDRVDGRAGIVRRITVDGETHEVDLIFSLLGAVPNTVLAAQAGAVLDPASYLCIDGNQRTNVPGFYAAGDITGPYAHQVSSAVHEGAMAAQTVNYDLYEDFQRD